METASLYHIFQQHPVVTTDSRNCPAGSIFFALKGESFDGNAFAARALEQGCAYAVIDEPQYADAGNPRLILTDDVLNDKIIPAKVSRLRATDVVFACWDAQALALVLREQ